MTCFVEMHNRRESFPRAGIERVSIEESPLPPSTTAIRSTRSFVIERAEPALINAGRGARRHSGVALWMVLQACLVQLS